MDFSEFDFHPDLLDGIDALNFKTATPIQQQAIPLILQGRDLIGTAQTGTGKTAAFVLPILELILDSGESNCTQALIIVPTRELAVQIDQMVGAYSYFTGVSSIAVYGGGNKGFDQEKKALTSGADIIIATPGRLLAHLGLGYVKFDRVQFLVLDEADRLLDMGFQADILNIIGALPKKRQNLLFSATMPPMVMRFAKNLLHDPATVSIALSKPAEGVTQGAYLVHDRDKLPLMVDLLREKKGERIIVFGSTKQGVSQLYRRLSERKLSVGTISSDLEQADREQVMQDFRNRKIDILVATDVLSRGIDVDGIDLVVNYDVPRDAEDYVHRIGRTARAERKGTALTLVSPLDLQKFRRIEKLIGREVDKLPLPEFLAKKQPSSHEHTRREQHGRPAHENKTGSGEDKKKPPFRGDERPKRRRPKKKGKSGNGGGSQPGSPNPPQINP